MQHLPPLVALAVLDILLDVALDARSPGRPKHLGLPESVAVQALDVVPHNEFGIDEHFHEVAVSGST